jgi:hypothetical protein
MSWTLAASIPFLSPPPPLPPSGVGSMRCLLVWVKPVLVFWGVRLLRCC